METVKLIAQVIGLLIVVLSWTVLPVFVAMLIFERGPYRPYRKLNEAREIRMRTAQEDIDFYRKRAGLDD